MHKQRSWGDCGITSLLNAVSDNGVTYFNGPGGYERMLELMNGRDKGLTIQEISGALFFLGFCPIYLPLEGFKSESGVTGAYTHDSVSLRLQSPTMNGLPAIYQVKTKSGLLHFIYFDGSFIWDSSPNSPECPGFNDYQSIVDVVYILPANKPLLSPASYFNRRLTAIRNTLYIRKIFLIRKFKSWVSSL